MSAAINTQKDYRDGAAGLALGDGIRPDHLAPAHHRAAVDDSSLSPPLRLLPHLSIPRAQYYASHPAEWNQLLQGLPRVTPGLPAASKPAAPSSFGGTWQALNNFLPQGDVVCNPLITHGWHRLGSSDCGTATWFKLTPDNTGSYLNGTWSQIASLPMINGTQYAPEFFASAVLPDGRVIIMGGEYNNMMGDHTNLGAIYHRDCEHLDRRGTAHGSAMVRDRRCPEHGARQRHLAAGRLLRRQSHRRCAVQCQHADLDGEPMARAMRTVILSG